jgi:UDP-glucose 4-epimerase
VARPRYPKRAWVTGASGFLGRHVARRLADSGYDVIGFSRAAVEDPFAIRWGFASIEAGPFELAIFQRACQRQGPPSAIFHGVGSGSVAQAAEDPNGDIERTLRTTERLIDAMWQLAPSARLIYPSSAAVYGQTGPGPIPEESTPRPISVYGTNKLLTEEMCRQRARLEGLDIITARFFSVYGPSQRKLLLWELGQRLLSGERVVELGGTGEETRDFMCVIDAAAIVETLIEADDIPLIVNIGTGETTPIKRLARLLADALSATVEIRFSGEPRVGDPTHQQADTGRLVTLGHKKFTPLHRGIADYADWLRRCVQSESTCV